MTPITDIMPSMPSLIGMLRGLAGIVTILVLSCLLSNNRRAIDWKQIGTCLLIQIAIAICVLFVPFVRVAFEFVGRCFLKIIQFTNAGTEFVFGPLVDTSKTGFVFALQVLPIVIFFSALVSLLYYFGIPQFFVRLFARILRKAIHISGIESLVTVTNAFMGMTEAPILVRPYLDKATASEIFLVMTAGLATISGSVMGTYISMLSSANPELSLAFATHFVSASVMAIPAAVAMAKMFCPQTETVQTDIDIPKSQFGDSPIVSLINGMGTGLKMAINIAVALIVFIALIALMDGILGQIGRIGNLNGWIAEISDGRSQTLNLGVIIGSVFSPLMWLIGVPVTDIVWVGQLQGLKMVMNEMVGYTSLMEMISTGLLANPKSIVISTYMLSGFANVGSIGILIGGLGTLAPNHKDFIAGQCFRAMMAGTFASLLSATIVGMMY